MLTLGSAIALSSCLFGPVSEFFFSRLHCLTQCHFFCSIEAAVAIFAQARLPGIYKGDYLKELFRRYGDVADAPAPPPLPEWCFEEDEEDGEEDNCKLGTPESEACSSTSFSGRRRKEHLKLVMMN